MTAERKRKGPFVHRALVFCLGAILTLLFIWLLGFVLSDLDRIEPPRYATFQARYVSPELEEAVVGLRDDIADIEIEIREQREIQSVLQTSTDNSRATMSQLLALHRLSLEKDFRPTAEEQAALAESEQLFLANQKAFQEANARIAELSESKRELERDLRSRTGRIEELQEPARQEYEEAYRHHRMLVAVYKLAFLLPLFLFAAALWLKGRTSPYRPLVYAAILATAWKVGVVMHAHFPARVFKYVAIGAGILTVVVALVKLIRTVVAPRRDWLLKQYREAYSRHRCPICSDPIQRGPLRLATWTRKGPALSGGAAAAVAVAGATEAAQEPYVCPACGTRLFERCESCSHTRHSLLPYCESCGAEKEFEEAGVE